MARTSPATTDSVPQGQEGTLEEVLQMRGGSAARGPFSPMINVPEMAKRTLHLWHYLRGDGRMISVVIRTKNEETWIGRCLRAVADQTYPDFEVILVDNNSTDATMDIVSPVYFACTYRRARWKYLY